MMGRGSALAVVGVLVLLSTPATPAQEASFVVGAWTAGDLADYGRVRVTVEGLRDVAARDGVATPSVGVDLDRGNGRTQQEYVGLASRRLEVRVQQCIWSDASGCLPGNSHGWRLQGLPGFFGAAFLAGRTVTIGDTWEEVGPCGMCSGPVTVRIVAPAATSPEGTAFIAVIDGTYPSWLRFGDITLHMGSEHPYPLRIDYVDGPLTLGSYTPGSGDVVAFGGTPREATPLEAYPFEDGLPVEGTPEGGAFSWKGSRASALAPPPPGPLVEVSAFRGSEELLATGLQSRETWTWEEQYRVEDDDVLITVERSRHLPFLGLPTDTATSSVSAEVAGQPLAACVDKTVPIWDGIRRAMATGMIEGLEGYVAAGLCVTSFEAERGRPALIAAIEPPPHPSEGGPLFGLASYVAVDATTGLLSAAIVDSRDPAPGFDPSE